MENSSIEYIGTNMFSYNPFEEDEKKLITQNGFVYGTPGKGKSFSGDILERLDEVSKHVKGRFMPNNWRKRNHLPMRRKTGKKKIGNPYRWLLIDEMPLLLSTSAQKLVYTLHSKGKKHTSVVQSMEDLKSAYSSCNENI